MATYTPQSPIAGCTRGIPDDWIRWAERQGVHRFDDVELYINTVYEFAPKVGIGAHKIICQSIHETSEAHPKTGKYIPWTSEAWTECVNPAGIGVTSDAMRTWHDFGNGRNAALAHLVRVCKYVFGPVPDILKPYEHLDPRGAVPASVYGQKKTLGSFGHSDWRNYPTWAAKDEYGQLWADTLNRLEPVFAGTSTTPPDPQPDPQEGNDMPTYRTVIPGLPGGPLETSFPIHLKIVPAWRTNNRPGIKARTPRLSVQHETANSGTYAAAEANYLYNGAGGRQASWHFTVDDREGYVSIPVDEVAWQAGDGSGPGNYNGVACELAVHNAIVSNPTRRAQSQKNAAELMGKVGARLNATPPARQHANFMNKNCPAQMRNRGEWNRYVDWWHHFYQMEKAAMDGKPAPEQPVFYIGDTIKALVPLNLRQRAGTGNVPVIATLPVGTQAVINGPFEWKDGYGWLPVETSYGNGFVAMGENGVLWIEKVKDRPAPQPEPEPEPEPAPQPEPEPEPEPAPQYVPARPIPALLETDLKKYDTAEGITTDDTEQDYIFVADVIEFTKPTVAGQTAVDNPKPVHEGYGPGDRRIAAWLVKSRTTKKWHYILAGGDDEWVRVPYANTKRVSDAPLLPGQEWGESEEADVSDVINALKDVLDDSAN